MSPWLMPYPESFGLPMVHFWLLHAALLAGLLATLFFTAHILRQRRHPAATLGWLLAMLLLPWLAVPLYLAIGTRKLAMPIRPAVPLACGPNGQAVDRLLAHAGIGRVHSDTLILHNDGKESWSALMELVGQAHHSLDVGIFLLRADKHGIAFMEALAQRAADGVKVRLMLDGIGSLTLQRQRLEALRQAGVDVAWFVPLLHQPLRGRTNLRNHRKVVIGDGTQAWTGGRNVADEYFSTDAVWTDLSYTLDGAAALELGRLFEFDWCFATRTDAPQDPVSTTDCEGRLAILPSGPDQRRDNLHDVLVTACYGARQSIRAVTPYFVPDEALLQALCLAARRGVEVRLIMPQRSNHRWADWVRTRSLRELMAAGAQVRLVPEAMVHAKLVLFDDTLAVTGSANLDLRSLFLNFELAFLFHRRQDINAFADWVERLDARALDAQPLPASWWRETAEGLVLLAAFQI